MVVYIHHLCDICPAQFNVFVHKRKARNCLNVLFLIISICLEFATTISQLFLNNNTHKGDVRVAYVLLASSTTASFFAYPLNVAQCPDMIWPCTVQLPWSYAVGQMRHQICKSLHLSDSSVPVALVCEFMFVLQVCLLSLGSELTDS